MPLKADLHIHSCLSPCGSLEMSPSNIVKKAKEQGLELIALTDHNSALNSPPTATLCKKAGIKFIPGIEVTSKEGVHLVLLFPEITKALAFSDLLYEKLPNINNIPTKFGDQLKVDECELIIKTIPKLLTSAVDISISELVKLVHQQKGLIIPAHIDRPAYGIINTLGFLPDDDFDNIEFSPHFQENQKHTYQECLKRFPNYYQSSDAHFLNEIGSVACWLEYPF